MISAPDRLAAALAVQYGAIPQVRAVALGGSRSTGFADEDSDIDLYVYSSESVPLNARARIARGRGTRLELDNRTWEPGDEWIEADGTHVDVMFRSASWMEEQLARVLDRHEASTGYSTCFGANVRFSRVLFDRDGWFMRLQDKADSPASGGTPEYQHLAGISVSHPYNLRNGPEYRKHRVKFHHTQPSKLSIGERRKPDPNGKPGYLRVDTVHQGRKDGAEAIFFINSVDTVT